MAAPLTLPASQTVLDLLDKLHTQSETQEAGFNIKQYPQESAEFKTSVADKFIALDRDKSVFMYHLLRATGATRIVEVSRHVRSSRLSRLSRLLRVNAFVCRNGLPASSS